MHDIRILTQSNEQPAEAKKVVILANEPTKGHLLYRKAEVIAHTEMVKGTNVQKGDNQMPKEPETYRLNIEQLNTLFPNKETFTVTEIAKMNGTSLPTAQQEFPFKGKYISKVNLAYMLARKGEPTT